MVTHSIWNLSSGEFDTHSFTTNACVTQTYVKADTHTHKIKKNLNVNLHYLTLEIPHFQQRFIATVSFTR